MDFGVHPGHHQHLTGVVLLRDGWDQAVGVEGERREHSVGLDRRRCGNGLGGNFVHE